eukprot:COSAG02_NODE_4330_length_5495_cov_21.736471_3_plen_90_part_00
MDEIDANTFARAAQLITTFDLRRLSHAKISASRCDTEATSVASVSQRRCGVWVSGGHGSPALGFVGHTYKAKRHTGQKAFCPVCAPRDM